MAHPARRLHHRLETIHAVTYFAAESHAAAADLGMKGFWMGYFAFRSAPMGPVGPAVVEAVFANFSPARVRRALPDAWSVASPAMCLDARRGSAADGLRRVAGAELDAVPALLRDRLDAAVEAANPLGRPLFAANRELGLTDDPVEAIWQLATTLREQRGDGHVAAQCAAGLDAVEMHLIYATGSGFPAEILQQTRGWTDDEWAAGVDRLIGRGLLVDAVTPTDAGRELHEHIEATTDDLAARALGDAVTMPINEVADALTPVAKAISGSGMLPFPNPMGLPEG